MSQVLASRDGHLLLCAKSAAANPAATANPLICSLRAAELCGCCVGSLRHRVCSGPVPLRLALLVTSESSPSPVHYIIKSTFTGPRPAKLSQRCQNNCSSSCLPRIVRYIAPYPLHAWQSHSSPRIRPLTALRAASAAATPLHVRCAAVCPLCGSASGDEADTESATAHRTFLTPGTGCRTCRRCIASPAQRPTRLGLTAKKAFDVEAKETAVYHNVLCTAHLRVSTPLEQAAACFRTGGRWSGRRPHWSPF